MKFSYKTIKLKSVIIWALYIVFFILMYKLYTRQLMSYPGKYGFYRSDTPAHYWTGASWMAYSLVELIYGVIERVLHLGFRGAAFFIASMTTATVYCTYYLMKKMFQEGNTYIFHILAFICMFVMPIFLPYFNNHRYLGLQCGTIWHNTTYTGMRLAALILLIYFYDVLNHYMDQYSIKEFIITTVLLIIVNLMKPNFIMAFGPAMAVIFLSDCYHTKGKYFWRQLSFAIAIIISLAVVVYEMTLLFPDGNATSSSEFPFGFSFAYLLRLRARHPIMSLLQSILFPLITIVFNWKEVKKDKFIQLSLWTWFFSLLEFLFIHENGTRKDHGNISWGYSFGVYLVFLIALVLFYKKCHSLYLEYKEFGSDSLLQWCFSIRRREAVILCISIFVLAWHLLCGFEYFILIMQGAAFYELATWGVLLL